MPKSPRRSAAQGSVICCQQTMFSVRRLPRRFAPMSASSSQWPEIDPSLLEERRGMLPPFPTDLMPLPWRAWLTDTAASAGAPIDYVAQALFAAVSGLCGAGAAVRVTSTWQEPLVLWQLAVGRVSSGRSPARASTRRMLATVEEETQAIVVDDAQVHRIDEVAAANARGGLLWRDEAGDWFTCLKAEDDRRRRLWLQSWSARLQRACSGGRERSREHSRRRAAGAVGAPLPGRRGPGREDLYAWPHQPPFRSVVGSPSPDDGEALSRLRRIARKVGTIRDPLVLLVDERGLGALDTFMAEVHAALREAEGLEEAWMGKGRGTVVRLAGILELLDWSATGSASPPGHIGRERIEGAVGAVGRLLPAARDQPVHANHAHDHGGSSAARGPLASQQRHDMCHARAGEAGRAEPHCQCQRYRSGALSPALGEHRAADAGRLAGHGWPAHQHMGGQPGAGPYGGTSGKGGKGGN